MTERSVTLVTASDLPDLTDDDRLLVDALNARGVACRPAVWDDTRVDWAATPLTVIRSTWDYTFRRDEFVAWADRTAATTTLLNPPAVVRRNTHKGYLRELADAGVPVVDTVWLPAGRPADLVDLLAARGWRDAVVKPCVSAGARGTVRITADRADGAQAHLDALLAAGDAMVQPYVPAVAGEGELSVIVVEGVASHAARKRPADGDFRVQTHLGGTIEPWPLDDELRAAADAVVAADARAGHGEPLLYRRVDLLRGDDGVLRLVELELVEPALYLAAADGAAERLADAVLARLETS